MTVPSSALRSARAVLALVLASAFFWGCASVPAYLTMSAEELWEEGVRAYEDENWDDAIQMLERLVIQNPGHPRGPDARMYVARAYSERGEHVTAASEYERFLQLHRNHGLAPEASLGICEAYAALAPHPQRDQSYTRRALEACSQTWLDFRGLTVAEAADSIRVEMENRLAERAFQEAQFYQRFVPPSAPDYFERVVTNYSDTEWAPRALLAKYRLYVSFGWDPEAEETSERLFSQYPDSSPARELRTELGIGAEASLEAGVDR